MSKIQTVEMTEVQSDFYQQAVTVFNRNGLAGLMHLVANTRYTFYGEMSSVVLEHVAAMAIRSIYQTANSHWQDEEGVSCPPDLFDTHIGKIPSKEYKG